MKRVVISLAILSCMASLPILSFSQTSTFQPRWEIGVNFSFVFELNEDVPPLLIKYYLGEARNSALRLSLNPDLVISSGYIDRPYNLGRSKTFLQDEFNWVIEKALNIHVGIGWEKYTRFHKFSITRGVNLFYGHKDVTYLSERYIGGRNNGNGEKGIFERIDRRSIGGGVHLGGQFHLSKRIALFAESQLNMTYHHYPTFYSGYYDLTNQEVIQTTSAEYVHQRISFLLSPFYYIGISYSL